MKIIPGTDDFKVTPDGRVFEPDGVERNIYTNGDGYKTAAVKVNGKWTTMGVHRLVALAYLSDQRTEERDHVNHLDGDVTNNHVNNLEWVTVRENNVHAALISERVEKPKLVVVSPVGEVAFFQTVQEALDAIDCTFNELWSAIKDCRLIDGWNVRYNDGPIPDELRKRKNPSLHEKVSVKTLDTITGERMYFTSLKQAADHYGTTASLVYQTLSKDGKPRIFMKRYLVVRANEDFPDLTDEEAEALRTRIARPVLALKVEEGKAMIYPTAAEFYRENGFSKKAVTTALRNDVIREIGGYIFLYANEANALRLKQHASLSGESM